jgi:hypothetical protein
MDRTIRFTLLLFAALAFFFFIQATNSLACEECSPAETKQFKCFEVKKSFGENGELHWAVRVSQEFEDFPVRIDEGAYRFNYEIHNLGDQKLNPCRVLSRILLRGTFAGYQEDSVEVIRYYSPADSPTLSTESETLEYLLRWFFESNGDQKSSDYSGDCIGCHKCWILKFSVTTSLKFFGVSEMALVGKNKIGLIGGENSILGPSGNEQSARSNFLGTVFFSSLEDDGENDQTQCNVNDPTFPCFANGELLPKVDAGDLKLCFPDPSPFKSGEVCCTIRSINAANQVIIIECGDSPGYTVYRNGSGSTSVRGR